MSAKNTKKHDNPTKGSNQSNVVQMDPKEYRRLLDNMELREIYTKQFSAELVDRAYLSEKGLGVKLKYDSKIVSLRDDFANFSIAYSLVAKAIKAKKEFVRITCEYNLNFNTKIPLNEKFFNIYSKTSLPFNTWPFFREFVFSTTSRMNIPPLTLPLLKSPTSAGTKK